MSSKNPEVVNADPEILEDEETSDRFLTKAKKFISKLPFVRDVVAFYFAVLDPAVPISKKGLLAGAVLYFLSPLDLIPDFLGLVGFADDAVVARLVFNTARDILTEEHYRQADETLNLSQQPAPEFVAKDVTDEELS
jgi:uncharacterized membrane protein YkvA (DUF1232 family)